MDTCTFRGDCDGCTGRLLCHCLGVSEEAVAEAIAVFDLTTVKQVRERTGAGDGCTACHRRVRHMLTLRAAQPSPSPI